VEHITWRDAAGGFATMFLIFAMLMGLWILSDWLGFR